MTYSCPTIILPPSPSCDHNHNLVSIRSLPSVSIPAPNRTSFPQDVRLSRLDGHDGRSLTPDPSSTRRTQPPRRTASTSGLVLAIEIICLSSPVPPIEIQHVRISASSLVQQPVRLFPILSSLASAILHLATTTFQPATPPRNPSLLPSDLPDDHPRKVQMAGLLCPIRSLDLFRRLSHRRDHPVARLVDVQRTTRRPGPCTRVGTQSSSGRSQELADHREGPR